MDFDVLSSPRNLINISVGQKVRQNFYQRQNVQA